MKSYTDLEQSKKLAKILPLESVDMVYQSVEDEYGDGKWEAIPINNSLNIGYDDDILCWSLAALLSVLPKIQGGKPIIALDDNYITYPHMSDLHTKADNLIDACVFMIEKLHELNLL